MEWRKRRLCRDLEESGEGKRMKTKYKKGVEILSGDTSEICEEKE